MKGLRDEYAIKLIASFCRAAHNGCNCCFAAGAAGATEGSCRVLSCLHPEETTMLIRPSIRRTALLAIALMLSLVGAALPVGAYQREGRKVAAVDDVSWIDELIKDRWKESNYKPSQPSSDGEFIRRAYLDIVGHVPPADEARKFIDSKEKDKKVKLIQSLLEHDDYAKHWSTVWSNLLIGRRPGRDIDRAGMQKYLRDSFAQSKPWNKMVLELLTATGGNRRESVQRGVPFNGATNFLLSHVGDRTMRNVPATSFATRLFLGVQVQCTQCHDHPFNDRKQETFWGINAFFQQMELERHTDLDDTGRQQTVFLELKDRALHEGQDLFVQYDKRNAFIEVTPPRWVDGERIMDASPELNLRQRVAEYFVDPQNPYFAQAIVNRTWGHFLGRGIVHPIDDLGEHNPPSNPELLEKLAQHFQESNYDLKRLIAWITLSLPYSLSSQSNASNKEDDALFTHYSLKQLSPEQFFDSLMVASQANKVGAKGWEDAEKMKEELQRQFTTVFNNDENAEADTFTGTIPQALLLMNGTLIQRAISSEKGSFIHDRVEEIVRKKVKSAEVELLNDLYLAALSRRPTPREKALAAQLIDGTLAGAARSQGKDPRALTPEERTGAYIAAYQDIFWALLNSAEFVLNH
jgi:hypothetical protein